MKVYTSYTINKKSKLIMFDHGQLFPAEFTSLRYYAKLYDKPYQVIKLDFFILPPAIKMGIDCNPYVTQRNLVFCSIALSLAE
jgi:7-cyano-7-deazaguanine synthase in queuosine biosynthesis